VWLFGRIRALDLGIDGLCFELGDMRLVNSEHQYAKVLWDDEREGMYVGGGMFTKSSSQNFDRDHGSVSASAASPSQAVNQPVILVQS
jgi:hypothetical protein